MLINVFNKETASIEKIEASKIDVTKHFHRELHTAFTKEDLENFGVKPEPKAKTPVK